MNERRLFDDVELVPQPRISQLVGVYPLKALTISQPFAELIASGEKWVENRSWPTSYRGPLAIHAGKGLQYLSRAELAEFQAGGVVAVAELVACVHLHAVQQREPLPCRQLAAAGVSREQLLEHKHAEGAWCWVLRNVRRCQFAECRGAQGLWDFWL